MHDYESNHRGDCYRRTSGMHDCGSARAGRARFADALREGHAQGLYGLHRFANQERAARLLLQLAILISLAVLAAGCTSAGNPRIEERNDELICSRHETKVCPGAVGTASRIRKDQGACYCAPQEQVGN